MRRAMLRGGLLLVLTGCVSSPGDEGSGPATPSSVPEEAGPSRALSTLDGTTSPTSFTLTVDVRG